jgi:hypothetical protein
VRAQAPLPVKSCRDLSSHARFSCRCSVFPRPSARLSSCCRPGFSPAISFRRRIYVPEQSFSALIISCALRFSVQILSGLHPGISCRAARSVISKVLVPIRYLLAILLVPPEFLVSVGPTRATVRFIFLSSFPTEHPLVFFDFCAAHSAKA